MMENGFTILRNFISKNTFDKINKTIGEILDNHLLSDGNNPFVTNKKRVATCLYNNESKKIEEEILNRNLSEKENELLIKRKNYEYILTLRKFSPILIPLMENMFEKICGEKKIYQIMYINLFEVFSGSPEQEIHWDAPEEMNRYLITIPLVDTTLEMGPTIFYSEKYVKELRKKKIFEMNLPLDYYVAEKKKYGNIGFYHEQNINDKKILKKARCQYELNKCDITIHRDITLHSGGTNYTEDIRAFLFIVCDVKD